MPDVTDPGRQPITVVELEQPRCALRFGSAPCTASGTPRCYNTWTTCRDRTNIDLSGRIRWRFMDDRAGQFLFGDFSDADDIATHPIPCLASVSTAASELNIGAILSGKSPFGIRSDVSVTLQDIPWDDHVGDFYLGDRSGVRGDFWAKWTARNEFFIDMTLRIFEGYVGQTLADMQMREYVLTNIAGPDASGQVTLTGEDPLALAAKDGLKFPRETDMRLAAAAPAASTELTVEASEADLTDAFGVSALRYLRIGDEIIGYSGQTEASNGTWTLDGVVRGALDTAADDHEEEDAVQRVGRYEKTAVHDILRDLLRNHTPMPVGYIDDAAWDAEGDDWLDGFIFTGTVADPTDIEDLCGELCQQGAVSIWWDERLRTIPLLAMHPAQQTPDLLTDENHLLAGSATLTRDPESRKTRLFVYYGLRSPVQSRDEPGNYRYGRALIDETREIAGGQVLTQTIYSRWIGTAAQAIQCIARIESRYYSTPRFLSFVLDAKDRAIAVGTVVDVLTGIVVDSEGVPVPGRWQVIKWDEIDAAHQVAVNLQTFEFVGKFGTWMADDAPDYADATEAERLDGAWYADDAGKLPDGSEGYAYQ